ncbi:hypothetical protein H9L05_14820 [Hymenobacter qilianensis]|uniref:Uncharacterized protein n=1 Tax=Hymenobacter qilianensis TaxID=1385715 RepID=A0A7H0GSQ6_9BACT|nr:hypothetical protein [Hymenobacter qilianensis]QNP51322.1 hypothetical protein H9L05_14820 [Hymenobacter qilianensis]
MAIISDDYKDPPKDDPRPDEPTADSDQDNRPKNVQQQAEPVDTFEGKKAPRHRRREIGRGLRRPAPKRKMAKKKRVS